MKRERVENVKVREGNTEIHPKKEKQRDVVNYKFFFFFFKYKAEREKKLRN